MNKRKLVNIFLFGLLLVISSFFVSGALVTVDSPSANGYGSGNVNISATISQQHNVTNFTVTVGSLASGGVVFTSTSAAGGAINATSLSVVFPSGNGTFSDGAYNVSFSVVDVRGAVNSTNETVVAAFTVDNTVPNSTLTLKNNVETDVTVTQKIGYGTEATIDCGPIDSLAGIDTTRSSVGLRFPTISSFENLTIDTSSNGSLKTKVPADKTRIIGTFVLQCVVIDKAGNVNSTNLSFTTEPVLASSKSGVAAIEGFKKPVGKVKVSSGGMSDAGRLTTEGTSRLMVESSAVKLDINGEDHTVTVKEADADSVTLEIESEPLEVTIQAEETESVDVNGDGIADMEITYHQLFSKRYADLTFTLLEGSQPVNTDDGSEGEVAEPEDFEPTSGEAKAEADTPAGSKGALTVTLLVIVAILIIGYALIKGKKR